MILAFRSEQACPPGKRLHPGYAAAQQRHAFTLMETLVALALLGMIMASVSASISLYWKYRTLSRDRISGAQVLRGVMEDLSCDLRSCANPLAISAVAQSMPAETAAAGPGGSSSRSLPSFPPGPEKTLQVQEQQLRLNDSGTRPLHFVGGKNWIAVLTSAESPRFVGNHPAYQTARPQHVVWWWNDGGRVQVPLSLQGQRPSFSDLSASALSNGLVRIIRPFTERQAGTLSQQSADLVSDHVAAVQFRYFDGAVWHSEWNSAARLSLPRAVEVSLLLKDQEDSHGPFVIWIPQSE